MNMFVGTGGIGANTDDLATLHHNVVCAQDASMLTCPPARKQLHVASGATAPFGVVVSDTSFLP
jgi:hypothetical protein